MKKQIKTKKQGHIFKIKIFESIRIKYIKMKMNRKLEIKKKNMKIKINNLN